MLARDGVSNKMLNLGPNAKYLLTQRNIPDCCENSDHQVLQICKKRQESFPSTFHPNHQTFNRHPHVNIESNQKLIFMGATLLKLQNRANRVSPPPHQRALPYLAILPRGLHKPLHTTARHPAKSSSQLPPAHIAPRWQVESWSNPLQR